MIAALLWDPTLCKLSFDDIERKSSVSNKSKKTYGVHIIFTHFIFCLVDHVLYWDLTQSFREPMTHSWILLLNCSRKFKPMEITLHHCFQCLILSSLVVMLPSNIVEDPLWYSRWVDKTLRLKVKPPMLLPSHLILFTKTPLWYRSLTWWDLSQRSMLPWWAHILLVLPVMITKPNKVDGQWILTFSITLTFKKFFLEATVSIWRQRLTLDSLENQISRNGLRPMLRIKTCSSKTTHVPMSSSQREDKKAILCASLMKVMLLMEDIKKIKEITGLTLGN